VSEYSGPPSTSRPEPGWQPEIIEGAPPPRVLPVQDHAALNAQDAAARRFTLFIGAIAATTLAVLTLVLLLY
jgi:hypothetical protein